MSSKMDKGLVLTRPFFYSQSKFLNPCVKCYVANWVISRLSAFAGGGNLATGFS